MTKSRVELSDIIAAHRELGSVAEVAKRFKLSVSAVHERLQKAEYDEWKKRKWTADDAARLLRDYADRAARCELDTLATAMGRTKPFICRKAKAAGLTDPARPKPSSKGNGNMAALIATKGHPRGMKGKFHSPAARAAMSAAQDAKTPAQRDIENAKRVATRIENGTTIGGHAEARAMKTTWKAGWREVGPQRKFFRSLWEANYARYLQWLVQIGDITSWEHEPKTFWFDGIRRGVCSYKPDFRVVELDGRVVWHEVKGWMDDRSRVALNRFAQFYSEERLILVDAKAYRAIANKVGRMLPGWE